MILALLALSPGLGAAPETGAFKGPGRACLMHSYVDLAEGETLKVESAGTESARFTLRTPHDKLQLIESEIIGGESYTSMAVTEDGQTRVFRSAGGRRTRHLFHGRTNYSPDEDRLTLILIGLRAKDATERASLIHRIHVAEPEPGSCNHSYRYGWDLISETIDK
ncbi:hypothetical protein RZN05_11715 [Sphingomonas sp. HF-S4]|uniref:Uncharacterized protein n=1 Tax=Sphingomonas agrestis TaxID=3080540 RepID=A0ABU3Y8F3_9SPHN|nr:hypothetical protein [Sphingomonas sp. HF-S4]MDV3457654.1 hypothetical protein [Sphingomonas sp. HF-S4]